MAGFEQAKAQLAGLGQQQTDLQRAVAAGELWMEAGVAERAAQRCDQTADEINQWLNDARRLNERLPFGDNEDGHAAAQRFALAGQELISVMMNARTVFESMAVTYRAAGRTVAEADAVGEQSFRSQPE
ncbi:MAG TPA: hypothetical protein VFQ77_04015 [Pseudonocardiaceae bacterium]|jgi:hypothetical protein|nr:hypothetical protein [Pseudonocardiaceae bacterium]